MSSKFEITRRSVLAGVAFAGAVAPLVAATTANAEEEVIPVAPLPAFFPEGFADRHSLL